MQISIVLEILGVFFPQAIGVKFSEMLFWPKNRPQGIFLDEH